MASRAYAGGAFRRSALSAAGKRGERRTENATEIALWADAPSRRAAQVLSMISLAGKAALVTGGSRGIGAATVKLFAEAGADVVFNFHRNREAAQQVELEARKHGTRIESLKAELGRMAEAKKLVSYAMRRLGRLDIVVVNAGIWNAEDAPIEALGEHDWDDMIRVNLKSAYGVAHYAAAQMIGQKSGRIIVVSSTAGQRGEAFHSHYAASKGAVISFVKSLATELARHGILVNCVAPGWVDTDMSRPVLATKAGAKFATSAIPLGRVGTAAEIAGPILFLASDLATFVTGEVLNINGGAVLCG
jgi:3-oxoacyl-[acyl-carrier protein] reductase